MIYLGIDPGVTGGLAVLNHDGAALRVEKMLATEREVLEWLRLWAPKGKTRAVLELVHGMPKMGGASMFTFGENYGMLKALLTAAEIPFDLITPQRWQAIMQCRSRGDKNITKRRAQHLFPSLSVTHATADALLLAEYCRRCYLGIGPTTSAGGHNGKEEGSTEKGKASSRSKGRK